MISGGIKFFDRSMSLYGDGAAVVCSSGNAAGPRALDRNPVTYWRSVGSTDATTETFEVTLPSTKTFDRIALVDHNFKEFTIQWWNGATYQAFTNVVGIDGAVTGISETVFDKDTAYYEFSEVSSDRLLVTIVSTQVADAEKYLNQLIVTKELGTLEGYPQIKSPELSKNVQVQRALSKRSIVFKSDETFSFQLDFKDYPPSLAADLDLVWALHDRDDSFLVWLCGGRYGERYFRYTSRSFRLRDFYQMQVTKSLKPVYSDNVYVNQVNFSLSFEESTI